jgi:ribosomal protein S3
VPDSMVSLIIGRKGQQIDKLQSATSTKISILGKLAGLKDRIVSVTGAASDVQRAISKIFYIVTEKKFSPERKVRFIQVDKMFVKLVIPSNSAGYLIGRQGLYIKKMKSDFDVDVKIKDSSGPPCKENESIAVRKPYFE